MLSDITLLSPFSIEKPQVFLKFFVVGQPSTNLWYSMYTVENFELSVMKNLKM